MKSAESGRARLPWFVRMTNPLRVLGWALVCLMMVACLYPRDPSPLVWLWVVGWSLCWPVLAILHTRWADDPRRAGYRNILVDSAGFGVFAVVVSGSLIPATSLLFFQLFNSAAVGGAASALRGFVAFVLGAVLGVLVLDASFAADVGPFAAWVCMLCMVLYVIVGITWFYRGNRQLIRLRNYLPDRVAKMVLNSGSEELLQPRRARVTVCAFDLRGFTAFSDAADPEQVIALLRDYYAMVGTAVEDCGGTVERFAGDGMVAFFNAPEAVPDAEARALHAALRVQSGFRSLRQTWLSRGHDLGLGIGVASGEATVGTIGFGDQWQYAAIGTVTNLSARLCAMAADGEVLVSGEVLVTVGDADAEDRGEQSIRGLGEPVPVFNVRGLHGDSAQQLIAKSVIR